MFDMMGKEDILISPIRIRFIFPYNQRQTELLEVLSSERPFSFLTGGGVPEHLTSR